MRLLFAVILGLMLFSCSCLAQDDSVETATSALQNVLATLKQSVEKLSFDNDQLASRDNSMKARMSQLQMQWGGLQSQGDVLKKAIDKLQENNPGRAQQIEELQEENADLENRAQKAQGDIKAIQQSLDVEYQEDQKLLLKLKSLQNILPADLQSRAPDSQLAVHRQKEKLKLMKMIYDSQQRQEALHAAILDLQKNTPLLPAAGALAHQQLLKEQIKDLQAKEALYPPEVSSTYSGISDHWEDNQLRRLEMELRYLEQNYSRLKYLMEQMSKKAQSFRLTGAQHAEEEKLQGSIDDLSRQGVGLRAQLDDLRTQMVDLDKRKSRLEGMIQP